MFEARHKLIVRAWLPPEVICGSAVPALELVEVGDDRAEEVAHGGAEDAAGRVVARAEEALLGVDGLDDRGAGGEPF